MNGARAATVTNRSERTAVVAAVLAIALGVLVRTHGGPETVRPVAAFAISSNPVDSLAGLRLRSQEPLFSLDTITVNGRAAVETPEKSIVIRSGDEVSVAGWAADGVEGEPANAVFAAIGEQAPSIVRGGGERPDVAEALGNPKLSRTGFNGKLVTSGLAEGTFPLRFFIVDAAATTYNEVPSPLSITVR